MKVRVTKLVQFTLEVPDGTAHDSLDEAIDEALNTYDMDELVKQAIVDQIVPDDDDEVCCIDISAGTATVVEV